MELLYMYIKKFNNFIIDQNITFTNNYKITLDNGILKVTKEKNLINYNKNIKNVTLFVGRNGCGKTTLLDIIGMNRSDRLNKFSLINDESIDDYFLLYYLYKDDYGQDIFGIEYSGDSIFTEVIKNCKIGTYRNYNESKVAIGILFSYDGNQFIDTNKHFFSNFKSEYDKVADYIKIVYPTESYRSSDRINITNTIIKDKDSYMAPREYFWEIDEAFKYKIIYNLKNNKYIGFSNEAAMLTIKDKIDYDFHRFDSKKEYDDIINGLEKKLYIYKKDFNIFMNKKNSSKEIKKKSSKSIKESYILNLISKYIIHQFMHVVCEIIENNLNRKKRNEIEYDGPKEGSKLINSLPENVIEFVERLDVSDSSYFQLGKPTNLDIEYKNLNMVIEHYNKKYNSDFTNKCEKLLLISRYIYSRIQAEYYMENGCYEKAFEEFVAALLELKAEYFKQDCIEIELIKKYNEKNNYDENLYNALKLFGKYRDIEDEFHNGLLNVFTIRFSKLSEGEKNLVDTMTKINYSIKNAKKDGLILLLLDEPDTGLHPEWCRIFLKLLIDNISEFDYDVQVLITTHSPYMLSDIFPQNAYRFRRESGENNILKIERLSEINSGKSCFGANIYDLISNSFFMDNSIGEFATQKINQLIQEISTINRDTPDVEKEKMQFIIDNIGEPLLKEGLERRYKAKIAEISKITVDNTDTQYILDLITDPNDKKRVKEFLQNRGGINHD